MIEEPPLLKINTARARPSAGQIAAFQNVPTGIVVDAMGGGGALAAGIAPMDPGAEPPQAVAGPALTADCGPGDILALLAALAFVGPGDVLIGAVAGHQGCAAAGDRLVGMLKNNGAAALVTDGPVRDFVGIRQVGLPVWCAGLTPNSPFGTGPGAVGFPVQIGGRQIASGDMIVADRDGVVCVPFAQLDTVIARIAVVRSLEEALDAQVRDGLKVPPSISDLLESDRVEFVE